MRYTDDAQLYISIVEPPSDAMEVPFWCLEAWMGNNRLQLSPRMTEVFGFWGPCFQGLSISCSGWRSAAPNTSGPLAFVWGSGSCGQQDLCITLCYVPATPFPRLGGSVQRNSCRASGSQGWCRMQGHRAVMTTSRSARIIPLLHELNWLPLLFQFQFKVLWWPAKPFVAWGSTIFPWLCLPSIRSGTRACDGMVSGQPRKRALVSRCSERSGWPPPYWVCVMPEGHSSATGLGDLDDW